MKKYEIMTIIKAELAEKGAKDLSKKVQDQVESLSGKISSANFWGKRKLSYEIKREKEGFYDVINFELDPEGIQKLKSKLNLMDGLLRYLITAQS